jgi:hypothetical protein
MDKGKVVIRDKKSQPIGDKGKGISIAGPSNSKKGRRVPKQTWIATSSKQQPQGTSTQAKDAPKDPKVQENNEEKVWLKDRITMIKWKDTKFVMYVDYDGYDMEVIKVFSKEAIKKALFVVDPNHDFDDIFPPT